jgi:hypothetical protein
MKLTQELLMLYRTPRRSWTKVQLEALGLVRWPPEKGWMQRVLGMELTEEQWLQFTDKNPDQKDLSV